MEKTIYYFIGIVIVGVISTIFIFSSVSSDTWQDWRTGFTGVSKPDERDEQINCMSKGGVWKNNSCNIEDKPVQTEPVQTEPVQTEPVQTEPVQTEPIKTEPSIGCSGFAKCFAGKVTKITDGDTIDVDEKSIRFALISAPELGTLGGTEARDYIKEICPVGSNVIVDEDDGQINGSYGRTIAKIYCKGINLNESILEANLATIYTEFCSVSEFSKESWAQHGCSTKNQVTAPPMPKEIPEPSSDESNCDPSYPDFCIAPSPPDLDCKDVIPHKNFRVLPPDPHRFDRNNDGIGCEGK